eukprot:NODE_92_length_21543_cov_0.719036.p1 type:complete len:600 gc:universal NODE_92_length_21543_cov_0.719036:21234-19435(-)
MSGSIGINLRIDLSDQNHNRLYESLKLIHTNIKIQGEVESGEIVISNSWDTLKNLHEPITIIYVYENKNSWLKRKDKQIADAVFPVEMFLKDTGLIVHAILQLAYRKNREYELHCELQEEKKKRALLEEKIKNFKNNITSTVITPINSISNNINNLLNQESLTDSTRNMLEYIAEDLKKTDLNKPDFLRYFENLLDADLDRETKSWLATEVLRDTPESVSFEMQRNRRRASSLGLLYWKDRKHSFNSKSDKTRLRDSQRFHSIPSNTTSPTDSIEISVPLISSMEDQLDNIVEKSTHGGIEKHDSHTHYHQGLSLLTNTLSESSRSPKDMLRSPETNKIKVELNNFDKKKLELLQDWSFHVWDYTPSELIKFLVDLFDHVGFLKYSKISRVNFSQFCCAVYKGYSAKINPYHNFHHAFDVTQAGFLLITRYVENNDFGIFTENEAYGFLLSCLCHDLGHDGRTNTFHISTISPLALLYNDQSPLENYHCHQAFLLLNEFEILSNYDTEDRLQIRSIIIRCILATDLAKHVNVLGKFNEITVSEQSFKPEDKEHRTRCLEMLMKCADISNVLRPLPLAKRWGEAIQVFLLYLGRNVSARR